MATVWRRLAFGGAVTAVLLVPISLSAQATDDPDRTDREVYEDGCAACHGTDGRGSEPSRVGFDIPLPDFSDCSFATREPNGDWGAIVHAGGPVRGFDRMMPSFTEALSAGEIDQALAHIRTFCGDDNWPRGELNLPRPLVTEKAYPEDEAVLTTAVNLEGASAIDHDLLYEKRLGARSQYEIVLPLSSHNLTSGSGWTGGVGDIAVAVKHVLAHNLGRGSIVSVTGELVLPTGDADRDLGKGTAVFEPFITVGQLFPADWFLHVQAGLELPSDTERAEREGFWRAAVGKSLVQGAFGRTWSPMLEVLGSRELEDEASVSWDLVPQVQVTLNTRQHVMFNVGVRVPVTDAAARDTRLVVYLLWDWFDGGFLEGW